MAGSQFISPQRVRPSIPPRRFTLEQANKSLVLVRRIAGDVANCHSRILKLQVKVEHASPKDSPIYTGELEAAVERMGELVGELNDLGIELRDASTGLVDFVGRHKGRDVYLCWKLGEDTISHWHELGAGYAGRQAIGTLDEAE